MNKILTIFLLIFISCKSPSQEKNADKNKITSLQKSFAEKEDQQFLEEFPKNFNDFKNTFGWNDQADTPQPLYKDSDKYIKYFFSLLEKPQYKKYEYAIVSIAEKGKWEADAVGYFQDESLNYLKKNKKMELINALDNKKAESVISFLFDGPVFNNDEVFVNDLNADKKNIFQKISKGKISHDKQRSMISSYENNDAYIVKSFDVNKDGISDKVVTSKPYEGNDLFIFYGTKDGNFKLNLETTNFSEDGGNIIKEITSVSDNNGFQITTTFPDRGYYEKEITLKPENNTWFLKKIVYKTMSGVSEDAVKYICEVPQNVDITKSGWTNKINQIPSENERAKKCRTESTLVSSSKYIVSDPDGYTNLRKDKNTSSKVLQKINSGEFVEVINSSSDWFLVETKEGNKGFVHKSRLKNSKS